MTDWTIILRSLTGRLFSTVTTVVTVAVAVALMLVLLMMRDSGRRAFERGSGNMHFLVSADASPLVSILNGVFYANAPRNPLTWKKYLEYARDPRFVLSAEQEKNAGLASGYAIPTQLGDSYYGLPVMATTTDFFTRFTPDPEHAWELASGRFFEREFEVVVGAAAARETGLRAGEEIFLTHGIAGPRQRGQAGQATPHEHREFVYRVVGVLRPSGSSHDRALFTDLTSTWIIHAHDRRQREDPAITTTTAADLQEGDRKITGVYLRLSTRPGSNTPGNLLAMFDTLRRDTSITVAQPTQEIDTLFKIVSNIDQIFLALAVVVMVSSGIAIMLALYNSMEQRRRQIAVLRVLGCSRPRIFGLVVTESAVLGLAGAAVGLGASLVCARIVAGIMKERLGLVVDPALAYEPTLAVLAGALALASLAGIVPAAMAYNTPVAKNLRPLG